MSLMEIREVFLGLFDDTDVWRSNQVRLAAGVKKSQKLRKILPDGFEISRNGQQTMVVGAWPIGHD